MDNVHEEELRSPWDQEFTPLRKVFIRKRDHCPVCFKPYELIDNELLQTCFHPQNVNICGRHGLNNHNCGS